MNNTLNKANKITANNEVDTVPTHIYKLIVSIIPILAILGNTKLFRDTILQLWQNNLENEPEVGPDDVEYCNSCASSINSGHTHTTVKEVKTIRYEPDMDTGIPFLDIAALAGALELLQYFIEVLEFSLYDAYSIMRNAASSGNIKVIEYLLSKGCEPVPLSDAIGSFSTDFLSIELLISYRFSITSECFNIVSAKCDILMLELLLMNCPDFEVIDMNEVAKGIVCSECSVYGKLRFLEILIEILPVDLMPSSCIIQLFSVSFRYCRRMSTNTRKALINGLIVLLQDAGYYNDVFARDLLAALTDMKDVVIDYKIIYNIIFRSMSPNVCISMWNANLIDYTTVGATIVSRKAKRHSWANYDSGNKKYKL